MVIKWLALLLVCVGLPNMVVGHARWKCPPPRDVLDDGGEHIPFDNTSNYKGPCGENSGDWGYGEVFHIEPGWITVSWEEAVSHKGAPFRIALLDEQERVRLILLDHIPHDDTTSPMPGVETTYAVYKMSIRIPDVDCPRCSLQMVFFQDGLRIQNHSCSDVVITGSQPIESFELDGQPGDWPYKDGGTSSYTSEAGEWEDGWIRNVPEIFTTAFTSPFSSSSC